MIILPETILFDFDGTLVDSMSMWTDIDVEYLGRYGMKCPDGLQQAIEGMSTKEMCSYFHEQFGIPRTDEEMIADWTEMSRDKYLYEIPLKDGVRRLLPYLKEKGVRMGIATSTELDIALPCLENHGISSFFETVTTTTEAGAGKPDPAVYLLAAERLGVSPGRCLAVEDLPAGILAAKRAGMKTLAVEDRFSADRREEKKKLADHFVMSLAELLPLQN